MLSSFQYPLILISFIILHLIARFALDLEGIESPKKMLYKTIYLSRQEFFMCHGIPRHNKFTAVNRF